MPAIAPLTIANDLLGMLTAIADLPDNDIRTARLKREFNNGIIKLEKVDPAAAYRLRSQEAAIRYDYKSVVDHFNTASRIERPNANSYRNYMVSLSLVDHYREAAMAAQSAVELSPNSSEILEAAVTLLPVAGEFESALNIVEKGIKAGNKSVVDDGNSLQEILSFLEERNISEAETISLFSTLSEVAQEYTLKRMYDMEWGFGIHADDEEFWLSFKVRVKGINLPKLVDINTALAEKIAVLDISDSVTSNITLRFE